MPTIEELERIGRDRPEGPWRGDHVDIEWINTCDKNWDKMILALKLADQLVSCTGFDFGLAFSAHVRLQNALKELKDA